MKLNKAQQEAIESVNGNFAVIATAGSGKTTVLTKKIGNMVLKGINPTNILAITFSKKAKETIQSKLENINIKNVNVETFHSLALKIIKSEYGNKYTVWTQQWEKDKLLQSICAKFGCEKDDIPYNEINTFIAFQKVKMVDDIDKLIYFKDMPFPSHQMKQIYGEYEEYKSTHNLIEFDDFLNMANKILDLNHNLLARYRDKFKYILSDEFQDVSMSQSLLLYKLNTENTMIVGDPLQAIYSFRGGESKYILNFDKTYNDVNIINLNTNYRCSKEIVCTANTLAHYIPDSNNKFYIESVANNPSLKKPEYKEYKDEYQEADEIAKQITKLVFSDTYKFSDISILARTNAQLTKIQTVFHDHLIPFEIVDGRLFTELPEIKLLTYYLKLSIYENDNNAFEYLYNKPNRWLDKKFLQEVNDKSIKKNLSYYHAMALIDRRNWRFKNGIDEIYEVINYLQNKRFANIGKMVRYLRERLSIDEFVSKGKQADDGSFSEQIENINSFENFATNFTSVKKFIEYLENLNNDVNLIKGRNKVNLSTIHKAKGLEFPIVFIIGCNEGILPHKKNDCIDDEKRLFYVAITRAEKELYLSSTLSYNANMCERSSFIDYIKDTIKLNVDEIENKKL